MDEKMMWEAVKRAFPDEWLLVIDFELDQSGHIIAGVVNRHSKKQR